MKNRRVAFLMSLTALIGLTAAACSSDGSSIARPSSDVTASGTQATTASPASPLEGEWHQDVTCEDHVRTFQEDLALQTHKQDADLAALAGNNDTSLATLLEEYSRQFAWGPNAKTATSVTPEALCKGAPDQEASILFQDGVVVVNDLDGSWGPATLEIVDDHTFTANDGYQNFGPSPTHPTARFSFRIDGDTLTITPGGLVDAWAGATLEEAPWTRVS